MAFGLVTLLMGALLGALLMATIEAEAAVGDTAIVGRQNISSGRATTFQGQGSNGVLRACNTNDHPALDLQVNGSGPPMSVDSKGRVKMLNADYLDGRHARELIRAAVDFTADAPNANGQAATATITTPGPGILLVTGSIHVTGTTFDRVGCSVEVDGGIMSGTERTVSVHRPGGDHTDARDAVCATDGARVVDGGTHNVSLRISGRDVASLEGAYVWTIWVPFDGDGNVPTP